MHRIIFSLLFFATAAVAQDLPEQSEPDLPEQAEPADPPEREAPMTVDRLSEIITALDPGALQQGVAHLMTLDDLQMLIVTDEAQDRMRAMIPIQLAEEMTKEQLYRVMQANFDTTLDARYAIADGRLWATFIHPLSKLDKNEFISGIGQTVNIVRTYGTLYSGGLMQFGQGDSGTLQREFLDDLLKKGEEI